MADPVVLDAGQVARLQAFAAAFNPVGQTYDSTFYTDPNTQYINLDGLRFFLSGPNPNYGPSRVDGFHLDLGGNDWAQYDLQGNFQYRYKGGNTLAEFMTAAAFAAAPFGAQALTGLSSVTSATAAGDAFLPGALGADGLSSYAVAQNAALAQSLAPWAVEATAAAGASLPAGAGSAAGSAASAASSLLKPVAAVVSALTAAVSRPGTVNANGYRPNTNNTATPGQTIGGIPVLWLAAGAAILALA